MSDTISREAALGCVPDVPEGLFARDKNDYPVVSFRCATDMKKALKALPTIEPDAKLKKINRRLLKALKNCLDESDHGLVMRASVSRQARAAIAAAKGEQG